MRRIEARGLFLPVAAFILVAGLLTPGLYASDSKQVSIMPAEITEVKQIGQSKTSLSPSGEDFYTIPEVYADIASLDGQTISVFGEYVSDDDSKLVTAYGEYMSDELMPPSSILFLNGTLPDSAYWYGGIMIVTGSISTASEPYPVYPQDTLQITITASSYQYLYPGFDLPPPSPPIDGGGDEEESLGMDADCDPCKFAIFISGGGNAAHNKPSYWNNIEALYQHKTKDAASGGGGYCPENVKVIYFDGNSGNTGVIPDSMVASATEANIQQAHEEIAKKIADCERDGKDATVQKMITNHGANDQGAVLLGANRLSPEELKNMQQELIDSCCNFLYDEFLECYGGDMLNGLKEIDDKAKTEIHGNSAAGENTTGWSSNNGKHEYLKKKIERLEAGDDYETAVDSARAHYKAWLAGWIDRWQKKADSLQQIIDTLPPGATRTALEGKRDKYSGLATKATGSLDEAGPSWVRLQFKEYCEWKKVVCPPGGRLDLKFKGSGGCGNVSIYKETAGGGKIRVKTLNWNLPGGLIYKSGNENRNIKVGGSGGTYWIHNDNDAFTVTVDSWAKQDTTPESESNRDEFAGGSCGANDGCYADFGWYTLPEYTTTNTFGDNFDLQLVPAALCPYAGVGFYIAQFDIPVWNEWWGDMEVCFNVLECYQPGTLVIQCPDATNPWVNVPITGPGFYTAYLGGIIQRKQAGQIVDLMFDATTNNVSFVWDNWGLRSRVETSVDVIDEGDVTQAVPSEFTLKQNYPNPFNPSTVIIYSLERPAVVRLQVYNILGQMVREFAIGRQPAGTYQLTWDGRDSKGRELASGVYFYRIKAGDYVASKKMLLLK